MTNQPANAFSAEAARLRRMQPTQGRADHDTIKASIEHAEHVSYLRRLNEFLSLRPGQQAPDWLEKNAFDDVFVAFIALHLYLYMAALRTADLVIDVNKLASNTVYATETEHAIAQESGLRIDLSGAAEAIEAPASQLHDPPTARAKIEALFPHAAAEVDADETAITFARRLLEEMWAEHARYTRYASAAHRLLSLRDDAIRRLEGERDALCGALKTAKQEGAQALAEMTRWRDAARAIGADAVQANGASGDVIVERESERDQAQALSAQA